VFRLRPSSYQQIKKIRQAIDQLVIEIVFGHSFKKTIEIFLVFELNAYQGRPLFAVVFLGILKMRDVVIRAEHIYQELPQSAGSLRKANDEIMLYAFIHQ